MINKLINIMLFIWLTCWVLEGGQILRKSHSGTVNIFFSMSCKNYVNLGSVDVTYVLIHSSSGKMTKSYLKYRLSHVKYPRSQSLDNHILHSLCVFNVMRIMNIIYSLVTKFYTITYFTIDKDSIQVKPVGYKKL